MDKSSSSLVKLKLKVTKNGKYRVHIEGGPQITVETNVVLAQGEEGVELTNGSAANETPVDNVASKSFTALPDEKMIVSKIEDDGSVLTQSCEESGEYTLQTSKMV